MRKFTTGATRDVDDEKLDYEGFLSPLVIRRYAEYMHKCRKQADGQLRGSDNWKSGMPRKVYVKSLWRHFWDVWYDPTNDEAICGALFNLMGLLHELLLGRNIEEDEE